MNTCDVKSNESPAHFFELSGIGTPRLLAFRRPAGKPREVPPPPPDAALGDKMQWFAGNQPHILEILADTVETLLEDFRPAEIYIPAPPRSRTFSATPAMTAELDGDLRYRSITVHDPDCVLAPLEDRIGKRMDDILPRDLMVRFRKCLARARRDHCPRSYTYRVKGAQFKGTIVTPSPDTVVITVTRLNLN